MTAVQQRGATPFGRTEPVPATQGLCPRPEAVRLLGVFTMNLLQFSAPLRLAALCCLLSLLPEQAAAHGVYIFAWADGPRICTSSYFSKSSKVRGGEVIMADSRGAVLDSGRSDDAGAVCFSPPQEAQELVFTVLAGQGHRGDYVLPAADVDLVIAARQREAAEGTPPAVQPGGQAPEKSTPASGGNTPGPAENVPASAAAAPSAKQALSPAERREVLAMIREELGQELGPVRLALAEQGRDPSPGFRDILGGLGWIFGLAAIGALYYNRKKGN